MTENHDQKLNEPIELAFAHPSLRPLQLAWRYKHLIGLGAVIGILLGTLYYVQARPAYQASAKVLVIKKTPSALPMAGSETHYSEDYLPTHQEIIRSPEIVSDAVREDKMNEFQTFTGVGDAVGFIIEGLKITREIRDNHPTNILNISFRGPVAKECGLIVNAVAESYRRYLNRKYENVSDETARLIAQAKDILENKLTINEDKYRNFRLDHPFLWKSKEGVSLIQDRLQTIEAKRSALLMRQTEIEGRIALFKKAIAQKRNREELLAMVAQSTGRLAAEAGKTSSGEDPLASLILQEAILREDFGRDHPQVQSLRKRIAYYKDLKDVDSAKSDDTRPADPVKVHLALLEQEAEDARIGAAGLAKLLKSEQEEAKKLVSYENQDETYRTSIARDQQLFDSISKRLTEVNLLKSFGGFNSENIAPAGTGWKVGPKPIPVFGVAIFLGVLAGFGMAYLAEVSDQSFRTPDEIRRQLGLPIVGHIPYFGGKKGEATTPPEGANLNPMLCTYHRSKSREAEAYRVVRTSLYFSNRGLGHKVIQVTSPDQGDGKSTLAANLAVSIAQSGKSVIIIDADFRRPRMHKVFGVEATQGLASVIMEQAELDDVIQQSAMPGLSVLPCGPIPNNPAELLTQPRLKELLAGLRDRFDFVIVDTPPLLAVSDPSVVAPHVDGVIMTVRISKNGRPHAKRAKEILATLGANVLGVVVNGVGRDAATYGYDRYNYGYSYGAYEYTYTYTNEYNDDYYKQDPETGDKTKAVKKDQGNQAWQVFSWLWRK